jgi:proteic killer suppression protein
MPAPPDVDPALWAEFQQVSDEVHRLFHQRKGASAPDAMDLPGFRLHPLKGDMRGYWAVTVRANWRIVWRFDGPDAVDVDLIDYH